MEHLLKTAYFSGLIDGEGYIGMMSNGPAKKRYPSLQVKMSCKVTIESLKDHFKCGNIREVIPPKNKPHHKTQWKWYVSHKSCIKVIEEILPYLVTKRTDADIVYGHRFIKKGLQ